MLLYFFFAQLEPDLQPLLDRVEQLLGVLIFGSHYANMSLVALAFFCVLFKMLLLLLWLLYQVTIQVRYYGNITPLSQMYAGNSRTSHIFLHDITFFYVYKKYSHI